MKFIEQDQTWLAANFPSLKFSMSPDHILVTGLIQFDMLYNEKAHVSIMNPAPQESKDGILIHDVYKLEVTIPRGTNEGFPIVKEVGGRIKNLAKRLQIPIADLHAYPDGRLCLCAPQAENKYIKENLSFPKLVQEVIIPYLYSHSFFEKYGRRPWGEYGHSEVGVIQYYLDQGRFGDLELVNSTLEAMQKSSDKWDVYKSYLRKSDLPKHVKCICGTKKRMDKCHPALLVGLRKLKNDINGLGIRI